MTKLALTPHVNHSRPTFHFDMKLPEQVLQFALKCAHVLEDGTREIRLITQTALTKTRTTTVIKLSLQALTKPVNTKLQRRRKGGSKPSAQVATGALVIGI